MAPPTHIMNAARGSSKVNRGAGFQPPSSFLSPQHTGPQSGVGVFGGTGGGSQWGSDPFRGLSDGIGTDDWGSFVGTMAGEIEQLQGASDRHFERTSSRESQLEGFVDGISGSVAEQMIDIQNPEDFASVRRAEQALKDFEDRTAQDMSAAALGIREQLAGDFAALQGGMRPDGTMMSPAEMDSARYNLQAKAGRAVQTTLTGIMSQYNQQRAQMGMNVAAMTNAAEQWNLQAQQINAANNLNALQLEAQGRTALSQYTMANKESVVSKFSGLMQLLHAGLTPMHGGGGFNMGGGQGGYGDVLRS